MRDLTIELKPRHGELARVASVLARQQVVLRAGVAVTVGTRLVARFVPSDIEAARRALDAADIRFEEHEILQVLLEARAGELAMLSTRLAEGGVTIHAAYLTGTIGRLMEVAIAADNVGLARRLLE